MGIKKRLECDDCDYTVSVESWKLKAAQSSLSLGGVVVFSIMLAIGLALMIVAFSVPYIATESVVKWTLFAVGSFLTLFGLIFDSVSIVHFVMKNKILRCPKCGHEMIPVTSHTDTIRIED